MVVNLIGVKLMRLIDADKLIRRMRIDMDRMKYQYNLDVVEGMSLAIGYIVGSPTAYDPKRLSKSYKYYPIRQMMI